MRKCIQGIAQSEYLIDIHIFSRKMRGITLNTEKTLVLPLITMIMAIEPRKRKVKIPGIILTILPIDSQR